MRLNTKILLALTFVFYHIPSVWAQVTPTLPTDDPRLLRFERPLYGFHTVTMGTFDPERAAKLKNRSYLETRIGILGTNSESEPYLEINATGLSFSEFKQGRYRTGGFYGWAEPRFYGFYRDWFSFDLRPRLPLHWSNEGGSGSFEPYLYSGSIKFGHGNFETELGRFEMAWGQGFSGSLLVGNAQTPFTGFQITNPHALTLPTVFRYIGPTRFQFMLSLLDTHQTFPHGFAIGERLSIHPANWLELGYAQLIILGGKGAPTLSFSDGFQEFLGFRQGNIDVINKANHNFIGDFRITLPKTNGAALYGELYAEDCCAHFSRDFSNLFGISSPIFSTHRFQILGEWVRTTEITYRNGTFSNGLADRGHIWGHSIGPDAMGIYGQIRSNWNPTLFLESNLAYEKKGRTGKDQRGTPIQSIFPSYQTPETRVRWTLRPTFQISSERWIRVELGYEHVLHFKFQNQDTRNHFLGSIETGFSF